MIKDKIKIIWDNAQLQNHKYKTTGQHLQNRFPKSV